MIQNDYIIKGNMQLVGRCTFNPATGKARYDNFTKYYKGKESA